MIKYEFISSKYQIIKISLISAKTWDEIHQFVQEAKFDIIFDLNVLKRTKDDKWNSTNARELMNYTQRKGYRMAGWELGNGIGIIMYKGEAFYEIES